MYFDILFNLSKQESSIINTYYFMFEIDKDVVEKISRVYFRDPLSLKTTYSLFQEHSLSFDNYDYLFKYPTDLVYPGELITIYLKSEMLNGVSVYVNNEFLTNSYNEEIINNEKVKSFTLKIQNKDMNISFIYDGFVKKYISNYYMDYNLQEEVLKKYYYNITGYTDILDGDYAYIHKYYMKNNNCYILYLVSNKDIEANVLIKKIGNYNFYNYSSHNLVVYYKDNLYDLEYAYENRILNDSEIKYISKLHNNSVLDYYQMRYHTIIIEHYFDDSNYDEYEKIKNGFFIDDLDTFKSIYCHFTNQPYYYYIDNNIFNNYVLFFKYNFYSTMVSYTTYHDFKIYDDKIYITLQVNYGMCDAIMYDVNFVFVEKSSLGNLSADKLNQMINEYIYIN